jgi:hypothetical protein
MVRQKASQIKLAPKVAHLLDPVTWWFLISLSVG